MKTNGLRTPLIYSAILLLFVSLIVYLTTVSPGGSIFGSLGTIIVGFFRLIQTIIGLLFGVLVSLAVLVGIFFGAVALIDRRKASSMFEGLRTVIADKLKVVTALLDLDKRRKWTRE